MIVRGGRVALPGLDSPVEADLKIEDGLIVDIGSSFSDREIIDAHGLLVIPGGIDPHVHFNDPGYTEREDFLHGTSAAASGGITTVIDMPCTSIPPVTCLDNLKIKLNTIEKEAIVDYGFFGGISRQSFENGFPKNALEIAEFVLGFKTYFISGMESFGSLNHHYFESVMRELRDIDRPILLHAEDKEYVQPATAVSIGQGDKPEDFYLSRPEIAETLAVGSAVDICDETGGNLHIVHLGTAEAAAKIKNSNVTGETAPHYLMFDNRDFYRIGSPLKVTPVVKSPGNKEQLWEYLADGTISFVASDHAPCPENQKNTGSIWSDYSGIPGSGTLLPFIFSEGYLAGRLPLRRFIEVATSAAAERYGISNRKGSIEIGKDADLVLIDTGAKWRVEGAKFLSKGKLTPFEGIEFKGRVLKTIVRGKTVYDSDRGIIVSGGYGNFIKAKKSDDRKAK